MTKSTDAKGSTKQYAIGKYEAAVRAATDFVNKAREAVKQNKGYVATAGNVLLTREVARRGLVDRQKLEECREYLKGAAWLPSPPSMADVLELRGYLSKDEINEILAGILRASAKVNETYAALAINLGYVTQQQVDECMKALGFDKMSLVLSHELMRRAYVTREQNTAIMKQLREQTSPTAG